MNGQHEHVTDLEYIERIITDLNLRIDDRFDAVKEAVSKAEIATEKRFESVNEWRGQSSDRERTQQEQIATFSATLLPRETFEEYSKGMANAVRRLEQFQSRILGALAFVTLALPLGTYFLTK